MARAEPWVAQAALATLHSQTCTSRCRSRGSWRWRTRVAGAFAEILLTYLLAGVVAAAANAPARPLSVSRALTYTCAVSHIQHHHAHHHRSSSRSSKTEKKPDISITAKSKKKSKGAPLSLCPLYPLVRNSGVFCTCACVLLLRWS